MEAKDWILLFVPIICDGIIFFFIQKAFEKRQISVMEKYKYIAILQQKVDNALGLFSKILKSAGNGQEMLQSIQNFVNGYRDVFYYYQQNNQLLKVYAEKFEKIKKINEELALLNGKDYDKHEFKRCLCEINELLQLIQNDCINHKI